MIKVNRKEIEVKHFPDGTQMLLGFPVEVLKVDDEKKPYIEVVWLYENDSEMFTLLNVVEHIRANHHFNTGVRINLVLPYIPNARMDRTKSEKEVFTLRHFCKFINSLNFDRVAVLDPHSDVSVALLDRVYVISPNEYIVKAIEDIEGVDIDGGFKYGGQTIIFFPDDGAMKRYKSLPCFMHRTIMYGKKNRDWSTGKILGLEVYNEKGEKATENDLKDKIVLMVDDIISYGGTLAYSADKLKAMGASAIYAYASHTENSVLDDEKGTLKVRINNHVVDELYTTNSIYSGSHPSITLIQEF